MRVVKYWRSTFLQEPERWGPLLAVSTEAKQTLRDEPYKLYRIIAWDGVGRAGPAPGSGLD